jgi:hypothetical protein
MNVKSQCLNIESGRLFLPHRDAPDIFVTSVTLALIYHLSSSAIFFIASHINLSTLLWMEGLLG